MFKVEDQKDRSAEIRRMVAKMKTLITKLILKMEERGDYADQ